VGQIELSSPSSFTLTQFLSFKWNCFLPFSFSLSSLIWANWPILLHQIYFLFLPMTLVLPILNGIIHHCAPQISVNWPFPRIRQSFPMFMLAHFVARNLFIFFYLFIYYFLQHPFCNAHRPLSIQVVIFYFIFN
jgi:hypothetical protein